MPKQLKKVQKKKQQLVKKLKQLRKVKKKSIPLVYLRKAKVYKNLFIKFLIKLDIKSVPSNLFFINYQRKKIKFLKKIRFKLKKKFFFRTHYAKSQNRNFRVYSKRVRKISRSTLFPYSFFVNHRRGIRKLFGFYAQKKKKDFSVNEVIPKHPVGPFVRWARRILTRKKPQKKKPLPKRKKLKYVYAFSRLRIGSKYASRRIRYWLRRNFDKKIKPYLRRLVNVLVHVRVYKKATKLIKPNWLFLPPHIRFLCRRLVLITFKYNHNKYAPRSPITRYLFPRSFFGLKSRRHFKRHQLLKINRLLERIFSNYTPRRTFSFNFRIGSFLRTKRLGFGIYRKPRSSSITFRHKSLLANSNRRVPKKFFSLAYAKTPASANFTNYSRKSKITNTSLRFFKRKIPYYIRKASFSVTSNHIVNKLRFFWLTRTGLRPKYKRKLSHFIRTRYASYQPFLGIFRRYSKTRYLYKQKRKKFFHYFDKLLSKRTFYYGFNKFKLDRPSSRDSFFIHIFRSVNNIFINFSTQKGRSIFVYSSGRGFFKGSKRMSPVAVESIGKHVSSLIKISKIKKVGIVFHTRMDFLVRALLRGLRLHLNFNSFRYHLSRPHNGLRKPSSRRI